MHWAPNLCRVCGHINETCHFIYQKGMEIEHKLKKCLHLNVFREDFKPQQICNNCYVKLNELNDFIEICSLTNMRFDTMVMNKQGWSNHCSTVVYAEQEQKTSVIVTSKTEPDNFVCADIDLYKDSMIPLENLNMQNSSMNDQTIIDIVENSNSFGNPLTEQIDPISSSDYHKSYHANDYYYGSPSVVHHSSLPESQCNSAPAVNYSFQDKPVENSVNTKTNTSHYYYNELSYTESQLNTHMGVELTNDTAKEKKKCVVQQVEKAVEKAKKMQKASPKLISVEAIKNYITPSRGFSKTKKTKKNAKLFECNQCEKKFMRKITLNAHMAIHTKLRPFKCNICAKAFAVKGDLTNHQRVHTDDYKCKHCNKGFPVPSKLQRHLRTHTNHRPFICMFKNCGRAFSDKRNLDGHKHTHSDERNYKCDACGKSYKTKNRLKEHSKAHSDNLQYKCEVCEKAYRWKANLLNHKKKHEGYICPYCNKDYVKACKLSKHKKECTLKCGMY